MDAGIFSHWETRASVRTDPVVGSVIGFGTPLNLKRVQWNTGLKEIWTNRPHREQPIDQTSCNFLKLLSWPGTPFFWLVTQILWTDFAFKFAAISHTDISLRKHDVKQCWLMSLPLVIHYLLHLHANEMEPVVMPTPPANQSLVHDRISPLLVNEPFICHNYDDFERYSGEQDNL